jgi:hypothetical protein
LLHLLDELGALGEEVLLDGREHLRIHRPGYCPSVYREKYRGTVSLAQPWPSGPGTGSGNKKRGDHIVLKK